MRFLANFRAFAVASIFAAMPISAHAQEVTRASAQPIAAATPNAAIAVDLSGMQSVASFYVSGLTASGATLTIEGSSDGRNIADASKAWFAINAIPMTCPATPFSTLTTDQGFRVDTSGLTNVRVRVSSTGSGTPLVSFNAIPNTSITLGSCGNLSVSAGQMKEVCVTPTVTASNAYGANFVVGGLLTFANVMPATGGGQIQSVYVNTQNVESMGFTFTPFVSAPSATTWTDAAVANILAADRPLVRAPITLVGSSVLGTHSDSSSVGVQEAINTGSTTLTGVLTTNAALTNNFAAASDVRICIDVVQFP